ncbi:ABC transporter ATP-binding protein [Brevibacterium luteolum]|nr:ABC transporter ATP-binding protein [Brevibacterium luteolum]
MNTPILTAHALTQAYQSTQALAGIDLTVREGEALAVMGASGSGKTTLLHALAGIIPVTGGAVTLAGSRRQPCEISSLGAAKRTDLRRAAFGFVFQQGLLMPELTAKENVAIAAMLNGAARAAAEQAAVGWLESLGMAGHYDKRIGQLSGGQQQRVAIARSQMNGPLVTFADEPTGALDSTTSAEVLDVLMRSTVQRGRTLIMVTHDPKVAATCSRVVTLSDGRIVADSAQAPAEQAPVQQAPGYSAGPVPAQPAHAPAQHTRAYPATASGAAPTRHYSQLQG